MKLEMRAYNLDIRLELEDNDAVDQVAVLFTVKDLIETLRRFEKVNVSVTQVVHVENHVDHTVVEDSHLSIVA